MAWQFRWLVRRSTPGAPAHPASRRRASSFARGQRSRQRGSFAIVAVIGIVVAVAALGVIDVANLYLSKRALQNVADLAALAAVQQMDDNCVQPLATAKANASSNGFTVSGTSSTLAVQCGRWDSSASGGMTFVTSGATSPLNGVQVTVTKVVPYFFVGPQRTLTASATAKAAVVGSFQVGTSLVQVNLLNGMLSSLLGGTSVTLDAVSWNGLANANIKIADLAAVATSAGTYDGLLAAQTSVTGLANILLKAVQKDGLLTANVSAAQNALTAIASLVPQGSSNAISLASISGSQALLQLGVANAQYAADATVNVLQMLIVGAEIAAAGKSPIALNVDLTGLSGVLPVSANLTLQVISPPTIAVGEPGYIAGTTTWRTMATTAQILLGVNATISTSQGIGYYLLLPYLLDVTVQLPLYVVVGQGQAWLQSAQCAATRAASTQTIGVQTGLANVCIGTPLAAGVTANQVSGFSCSGTNSRWTLASISLLGANVATVSAPSLQVPVVSPTTSTLVFDGNGNPLAGNSVNSNQIGAVLNNTLQSTVTQLSQLTESSNGLQLTLLSGGLGSVLSSLLLAPVSALIDGIVMPIVTTVLSTVLAPILSGLDTVLIGPLLQLLGVQLGVATVTDYPLACGVATLVK
ncbi:MULTISPECIES: TadG family pilus assembly protein [unclassified Paraburkholderia]|uniref:TadG family pilus assembly protein n=1 Tax=unclassified Paraburkholderia TaxID=2615204 RepID=UPI002AB0FF78|nr:MULTISPECIES: TadG family pilus assembly protein [unclassified Paraburkholderia]